MIKTTYLMSFLVVLLFAIPANGSIHWLSTVLADIPEGYEGMAYREVRAQDWFPLAIGNYWIYEGTAKITGEKGVTELKIVERVDVELQVNNGDYSLFICQGHPMGVFWLDDYETGTKDNVLEVNGIKCAYLTCGNQVYGLFGNNLDEVEEALAGENPADKINELNLDEEFDFPLIVGKSYAEESKVERADHWYEWYVKEMTPSAKWQVGGKPGEEYHLMFYTNPDRTDVWFVPGVGITRYAYHHNGTVMDVDVTLKEFNICYNK